MSAPILSCSDVSVNFGEFTALRKVSLSFVPGKLYAIIGPNGAGKTTLINALSGMQSLTSGQIFFKGEDITAIPTHTRTMLGLGRSFQVINIFSEMTVFENLRLAAQAKAFCVQPLWRMVSSYTSLTERTENILEMIGLTQERNRLAGSLSHGKQRAIELGLTLVSEPEVLLLDEPLAGVGHGEIERSVELIERIARGRTVILIEHNMDVVMSISEEVVVLLAGQVLAQDSPSGIQANEQVRTAYLGS